MYTSVFRFVCLFAWNIYRLSHSKMVQTYFECMQVLVIKLLTFLYIPGAWKVPVNVTSFYMK